MKEVSHANWNNGQARIQFLIHPVSLTCLDLWSVEAQKVS